MILDDTVCVSFFWVIHFNFITVKQHIKKVNFHTDLTLEVRGNSFSPNEHLIYF